MFKECPLMALCINSKGNKDVLLISQDGNTQKDIDELFKLLSVPLLTSVTIEFDGKYTPNFDDGEILSIHQFCLPEYIKKAIRNPFELELCVPENGKLPIIRALFVGKYCKNGDHEHYVAAFQKFKKEQYITQAKYNLFFSNETFKKDTRVGISISQTIDCLYNDGELLFPSFFVARQILELSDYYREATNSEIKLLLDLPNIKMDNSTVFVLTANSWERRKIASINDSGVLDKYSASQIKAIAKKEGVKIDIENKKVVIPNDKKERRIFLGFLDEEVYKGAFSQVIYQTNSKRKAK